MRDLASSGLATLAQNAKKSFDQIQNYLVKVNKKIEAVIDNVEKLTKRLPDVEEGIRRAFGGNNLSRTSNQLNQIQQSAQRAAQAIAAIPAPPAAEKKEKSEGAKALEDLTSKTVSKFYDIGKESIVKAMDFDSAKQGVLSMTKDADKGGILSQGLQTMSENPMMGSEVYSNAKAMLDYGVSVDKILPALKVFGDISGGNKEQLKGLSEAFAEVQESGRLTESSMKKFKDAGFNPIKEISKSKNMLPEDVMKHLKDGTIGSDMVSQALQRSTNKGGDYFLGLSEAAETPQGKLLALQNRFEMLQIKAGEALMPIIDILTRLGNFLMDHKEIVLGLVGVWATYAVVTQAATIAEQAFNMVTAMNPIVFVIAAIIGAIIAIRLLMDKYQGWSDAMKALWQIIKAVGGLIILFFKELYESVAYSIQLAKLKVESWIQWLKQVGENIKKAWEFIKQGEFDKASTVLRAEIKTKASAEIETLKNKKKEEDLKNLGKHTLLVNNLAEGITKLPKNREALFKPKSATLPAEQPKVGGLSTTGKTVDFKNTKEGIGQDVTSGGPRVININGVKFTDKIEIHVAALNEGLNQLEDRMAQLYLRILNSGAKMQ
ncbi:hypothetical protein [Filimonas lacunae]|nr:hypothetical protein [Filimonas lacunae]